MSFMIRGLLSIAVLLIVAIQANAADWTTTGNVSEHSHIHLTGYMDEMKIYQTDAGFQGQKLVVGTQGSGTASRTQTAYVSEDEVYFNEWGVFNYRPYTPASAETGAGTLESQMRNALCAKNYAVGSSVSESYTDLTYLVKDTTIFQNDEVSVYQIGSSFRGTAKVGARVKDGPTGVTVMTYGGTYIGDVDIREEIGVGDAFYLTCP